MRDIQAAMDIGTERYRDVIDALNAAGLPTIFTQTGGMCAALEVVLETGRYLLITDAGDSLSWSREEQNGWGWGCTAPAARATTGPSGSPRTRTPPARRPCCAWCGRC
ncbi:hypothetical protein RHODO2019_18590 (plasmid) [Rhodococcus antarcticus]|uniref:Thiamine pyrophosphate enzyme N-terminal TPP-binding domain-containing protein n=1 Tax=Rhodococcus antarcticus TaxID=2987751 RepID=A0ABY6P5Q8_9NOCA|nr:hypothetical protein [Rhodococcus antarcticus]UZJ27001.1 hypothetical protein RHODO2019_18590 [Rhodococcus antarcticus]